MILLEKFNPNRIFSIGGYARPNGFDLTVTLGSGNRGKISFRAPAPKYSETESLDWPLIIALYVLTLAAVYWQFWGFFVFLMRPAWYPTLLARKWKSWHWCEHQACEMIEEKGYPTQAALRKTSPVTLRCGSMVVILRMMVWALLATALTQWSLIPLAGAALARLGYLAIHFQSRLNTSRLAYWRFVIFAISGAPALAVAALMERLLFLRRPTPEQERYTLKWGQQASLEISKALMRDASGN